MILSMSFRSVLRDSWLSVTDFKVASRLLGSRTFSHTRAASVPETPLLESSPPTPRACHVSEEQEALERNWGPWSTVLILISIISSIMSVVHALGKRRVAD
jgi:hypothetical protein